MATNEKAKKKCRQYNGTYLKYGFIPSPKNLQLPMCLVCEKVFSNEEMKPSRLTDHLKKVDPDEVDTNLTFFESLCDKFQNRPTHSSMFCNTLQQNTDGLRASYNISLLIAKTGKPHTIGEELILPAICEVLNTVLHKSTHDVIKTIPLSNNSVRRRIDEMFDNVEDILCSILRSTEFSLQLDESTMPGNESLLLAYVRFIKDESLAHELLFARELEADTKGESMYQVVDKFFTEKGIPLTNMLGCATDGAPSMIGRHPSGCKNLSDRLHKSLQIVITAVNKIKGRTLKDRLFHKLCVENDEDFKCLLFHTEVRWLSKGNCLRRFYDLFETVVEFFQDREACLSVELKQIKHAIAYLTDIFSKFNEINLQLQENEMTLIKAMSVISTFMSKLLLFQRNMGRRDLYQFPTLSELKDKEEIQDYDLHVYCDHLDMLNKDMSERYQDLLLLEIPDWVKNPFSDIEQVGVMEEEVIELQNDTELKSNFKCKKSYQEFWLQKDISTRLPALWSVVKKLLVAFPSSYLAKRGFSVVTHLLSK